MRRKNTSPHSWPLQRRNNNGTENVLQRLLIHPGGFEIASFTEFSAQDRHKHDRAVEIYTVLEGRMEMYIDDAGPYLFGSGDEVVILPGTVHEIVQKKRRARNPGEPFDMLVRVHVIGCYGAEDKYVQVEAGQEWRRWS